MLYAHVKKLFCNELLLTQMEKCALMEALVLISNQFTDFSKQEAFLEELMSPVRTRWLSEEMSRCVCVHLCLCCDCHCSPNLNRCICIHLHHLPNQPHDCLTVFCGTLPYFWLMLVLIRSSMTPAVRISLASVAHG